MTERPTTDQITELGNNAGRLRVLLAVRQAELTAEHPDCASLIADQIGALDRRVLEIEALCAAWQPSEPTEPPWICAHCGEPITGPGHTWFGPMPEPGRRDAPRYHLGRNPCRAAGGLGPLRPMLPQS